MDNNLIETILYTQAGLSSFIAFMAASVAAISWLFILFFSLRTPALREPWIVGLDLFVIVILIWFSAAYYFILLGNTVNTAEFLRPLFSLFISALTLFGMLFFHERIKSNQLANAYLELYLELYLEDDENAITEGDEESEGELGGDLPRKNTE